MCLSDFSDPICDHIYHDVWLSIAHTNTTLYDELDGPLSYERCFTVDEYEKALAAKPFLNSSDPLVESFLVRIKGHLVMWPLKFLEKENMLSAATQVLASDLFA
jgi:phospholipase D1/2